MIELADLATVERDTLQQQIYRQLKDRLMAGAFRPGQPLSTRSIAAAVGASMMPVRDALRRLETERALVPGPNRTLMVPELDPERLAEIRDIRMLLEGMAVERAAEVIGAAALEELGRLCDAMDAAVAAMDVEAYLRANWAFHHVVYRVRGETLLTSIIESLWARMGPYIRVAASDAAHFRAAMSAHRQALLALRRRDGAAARAAIERDIRDAARDLAPRLVAEKSSARGGVA